MAEPNATQIAIEIVKIATGIATPVLVAIIGFRLNRTMQGLAAAQWANQKAVEKRIAVFDDLAPLLNDLYCYLMFVGNWKELKPNEVVQKKRQLDKKFYVYAALFSPELIRVYNDFIHCCFETYISPGHDARIRTRVESPDGDRRKALPTWETTWDGLFSERVSSKDDVKSAYQRLMTAFSLQLGLGLQTSQGTGEPPSNQGVQPTPSSVRSAPAFERG
jgi:hypothetical protein